ncbi:MAG TPA: hypothetical protein VFV99_06975, partial [Kofleriaceae bacterium]|nr:hypothetical protein [Kofleriaceae bacterium]
MQRCFFVVIAAALLAPRIGAANSTPELLYFNQPWTDTWRTYYNDDWSYVPGVVGFLGQDLTTTPGEDPQLLVGESTLPNDVDLMAAQTAPNSLGTGGVASFYLTDPVVALQ